MNRIQLQEAVYPRISQKIMEDIISFVQEREPNFGVKKQRNESVICVISIFIK